VFDAPVTATCDIGVTKLIFGQGVQYDTTVLLADRAA
jgi:hypothetical protein